MVLNTDGTEDFRPDHESVLQYLSRKRGSPVRLRSLRLLDDPAYTKMVTLRNPMNRMVSAYLDKFVKPHPDLDRKYADFAGAARATAGEAGSSDRSISFREFVAYSATLQREDLDPHWRPQSDYVAGRTFDVYGRFEDLSPVYDFFAGTYGIDLDKIARRKVRSPKVTDYRRGETEAGTARFGDATPRELRELPGFPEAHRFFDRALFDLFERRYRQDIVLYATVFGCDYDALAADYRAGEP
jgi:hypothetical protein